jgi:hypothetical protein
MKKFLYASLMLVFASAFQSHSQAQELVQVSLLPTGVLQLPESASPSDAFKIDVSSLSFASEQEMIQFFNQKCGDNHIYRAIAHENAAILYLQTKRQPNWTQSDWNAYLLTETTSKPIIQ